MLNVKRATRKASWGISASKKYHETVAAAVKFKPWICVLYTIGKLKGTNKKVEKEFNWLINDEFFTQLGHLQSLLMECSRRLPISIPGVDSLIKPEKFLLSNTPQHHVTVTDQVKCVVQISGDNISQADINIRLHKQPSPHRTLVQGDRCWKLQQLQDAGNHVWQAINIISMMPKNFKETDFHASEHVIQVLNNIMGCLQRGRSSLLIPKKRTIEEIINSKNMRLLHPQLPNDIAISFYIQSHKLVFAVYHIQKNQGQMKFEVYHAETSIPWLNEVLVFITLALQICQQMKDKVAVFSQYDDLMVVTPL
ncbi:Protein rogdi [Nymphon striatum]|nr:Protein rogdi [Nymphon striatum]